MYLRCVSSVRAECQHFYYILVKKRISIKVVKNQKKKKTHRARIFLAVTVGQLALKHVLMFALRFPQPHVEIAIVGLRSQSGVNLIFFLFIRAFFDRKL